MNTRVLRNASITLLGLGLGCIDVGSIPPPEMSQGGAGADAKAGASSADGATGSTSWTGYVENYMFASGSDALALMFASDAAGVVHGTLVFGKGTSPPPATDPNVGYPPNFSTIVDGTIGAYRTYVAEGYPYDLDPGTLVDSHLRFTVALQQVWAAWCLLETSSDGPSFCGPSSGASSDSFAKSCYLVDSATQKHVPIDCSKFGLCLPGGPCDCSGNGPCSLSQFGVGVTFDVFLSGANASGSIAGALDNHNIIFTKN